MRVLLPALVAAVAATAAHATSQQLAPGMPAPELPVSEWLKGKPVAKLQRGKVYLIEFWASW